MENLSKLETHTMEELKRDPKSIRKNQRQPLSDFWQKLFKDKKNRCKDVKDMGQCKKWKSNWCRKRICLTVG